MNTSIRSPQATPGAHPDQILDQRGAGRLRGSLPLLAFLTNVILLGVNFVAVRFSNAELPPFWGAALRFSIASVFLFTIVRWKRLPLPRGKSLAGAVLFGVLVFGATYAFLYWALQYVSSGLAAVTFATIPLMTMLLAVAFKLERVAWRGLGGSLLVLLGIGAVFQEQLRAAVPLMPLVVLLLGSFSGALSGIVIKRFPKSHPISTNAVAMAIGAAILVLLSLAFGETWRLPALPVTWGALAWLVASASIAFILMVWLLARWSASAASYGTVLQPLVTVAVASWLAGEQISGMFALGGALVLLGVYVGALTTPATREIPRPVPGEQAAPEAGPA
jgi:drug/metabolite transporter (DMT)-like permease